MLFDLKKCEKIAIPQGAFYLGPSDENKSVGYVELNPRTSLEIHNRPKAIENLTQVKGRCCMIVFYSDGTKIVELEARDRLVIEPKGTWHIHANPFDQPSLTYWEAEGDIRNIIQAIRNAAHLGKK